MQPHTNSLLQAALTVTLRSKKAFSVKLRPLNISVKKRVWELSSMTEEQDDMSSPDQIAILATLSI